MSGSTLLGDLRRQSLWDSIDSGLILPSAEKLLSGIPIDDILSTMKGRTEDITSDLRSKIEDWIR